MDKDLGMDLGFAETCKEKWRLLSRYFPSKLGGPPAWLDLSLLPGFDALKCVGCGKTCKFLLQLYSPGGDDDEEKDDDDDDDDDEENDSDEINKRTGNDDNRATADDKESAKVSQTFHRTLFVFVCAENSCNSHSVKCFRSQLPRKNKFYDFNPPDYDHFQDSASILSTSDVFGKMCYVCCCGATKGCSQCKRYSYCSKEHQLLHWKSGHKGECVNGADTAVEDSKKLKYFFDEYEIIIDTEKPAVHQQKSEKEVLQEYERFVSQSSKPSLDGVSKSTWESAEEAKIADKAFMNFRQQIADDPDQIIRYDKGGKPLLVSDESKPPSAIPSCELCGGVREFEFQVMSQTLSYLKVDTGAHSLDWGTLIIYTCKKSCNIQGYTAEFVWKQDYSDKDLVASK